MIEVSGLGLLGHLLELCRGPGMAADIAFEAVPLLSGAGEFAQLPYRTGDATRN